MINEIKKTTDRKMQKTIDALMQAFSKIRTGRAHPSLLENIRVSYYGADIPLSQIANITVDDPRVLAVRVWERNIVPDVEKAILKSDLGLNPSVAGEVIRVPLPVLTEETRKALIRQARSETEQRRIVIRNLRRDALAQIKELEKKKEISEDDERRAQDEIQKLTNDFIAKIDKILAAKEADLTEI